MEGEEGVEAGRDGGRERIDTREQHNRVSRVSQG